MEGQQGRHHCPRRIVNNLTAAVEGASFVDTVSAFRRTAAVTQPRAGAVPRQPFLSVTATLPTVENIDPPALPGDLRLPALWERWIAGTKLRYRSLEIPWMQEAKFLAWVRAEKLELLRRGFSYKKTDGKWHLFQWLAGGAGAYTLTADGAATLAAAMAPVLKTQEMAFEAQVAELDPLPGGLEKFLRGYQVQPARQLFRALRRGSAEWGYPGAVDFSDTGTGKTYQTLSAALATGKKVGVICPPAGRDGWLSAFNLMGAVPYFLETYEGIRGGWRPHIAEQQPNGEFIWKNPSEFVMIADELQSCRHTDTLTVRCFSAAIRQKVAMIGASASVAVSPLEFRFAGRIIGLHQGGQDWERFLLNHGCHRKTKDGPFHWDKDLRHLQKINARLFPYRGCRVRKQDLGDECPETEINVLPFDVPEAKEIESMWQDALSTIDRLVRQGKPEAMARAMRQRARMATWQRCETVLVAPLAELIRQDVRNGNSVAIFMNFNASREALQKALGTRAGIYGGMPKARRSHYIKEFQADREHIMVNNLKSGGASVSLHDINGWRPRIAYIMPTDDVVKMVQGIGRVDRVGGKSKSHQFFPVVRGGLTERMVANIRKKMVALQNLNDGRTEDSTF